MNRSNLTMPELVILALVAANLAPAGARADDLPPPIQAPGLTAFLTLHAVGAQVYQCEAGPDGKPAWTFREPIATLLRDGATPSRERATFGQHFAGPSWRLADGSLVQGRVVGKAPGETAADAPWLKLEITTHEGRGMLGDAVAIQRVRTRGGALAGPCEPEGAFRAAPYAADYVFLKK